MAKIFALSYTDPLLVESHGGAARYQKLLNEDAFAGEEMSQIARYRLNSLAVLAWASAGGATLGETVTLLAERIPEPNPAVAQQFEALGIIAAGGSLLMLCMGQAVRAHTAAHVAWDTLQ